jgi:hypothetical protein
MARNQCEKSIFYLNQFGHLKLSLRHARRAADGENTGPVCQPLLSAKEPVMSSFSRKFARREARAVRRKAAKSARSNPSPATAAANARAIQYRPRRVAKRPVLNDDPPILESVRAENVETLRTRTLAHARRAGVESSVDFDGPFIEASFAAGGFVLVSFDATREMSLRVVPTGLHERFGEALYEHCDPETAAEYAASQAAFSALLPNYEAVALTLKDLEDPARFEALHEYARRHRTQRPAV